MSEAYSLNLPAAKLLELLGTLESKFGYAILESVTDVSFVSVAHPPREFHFDSGFDLLKWERGRAFGESLELRWRRRGKEFAVLIISDAPPGDEKQITSAIGSLGKGVRLTKDADAPAMQARLWGEWQNPKDEKDLPDPNRHWWYEERIPRFLDYPYDDQEQYLAIEVARYRVGNETEDSQAGKESVAEPSPQDEESSTGDFLYRFVSLQPMSVSEADAAG